MSINPITFYKALSDDTRLKTLLLITLKEELCVCDLTLALELSQPKISRGKWVFYRISETLPNWAMEVFKQTLTNNSEYLASSLANLSGSSTTQTCH